MEKSDEYIDYAAYVRFLAKVTKRNPYASYLKNKVLENAVEKSELQTLWIIIKKLVLIASVVVACLLGIAVSDMLL